MKNQFYMILPSNSSMSAFPDNTTACFTTLLPQEINLKGNWEVGLSEILFPRTFLHVSSEDKLIIVEDGFSGYFENKQSATIPYGLFHDISEFLRHLNKALAYTHVEFKLSAAHNNSYIRAERKCTKCPLEHRINMVRNVLDILGYVDAQKSVLL